MHEVHPDWIYLVWNDNFFKLSSKLLMIQLTQGRYKPHNANLTVAEAQNKLPHVCLSTKYVINQESGGSKWCLWSLWTHWHEMSTMSTLTQPPWLHFSPHYSVLQLSAESKVITAQIIQEGRKCRQPLRHEPVLLDIPPLLPSSSVLLIKQHLSEMPVAFFCTAYLSGGLAVLSTSYKYLVRKWHPGMSLKKHYCWDEHTK